MKNMGMSALLLFLPLFGIVLISLNCSPGIEVTGEEWMLINKAMLKAGCRGCEPEEGEAEPGEGEAAEGETEPGEGEPVGDYSLQGYWPFAVGNQWTWSKEERLWKMTITAALNRNGFPVWAFRIDDNWGTLGEFYFVYVEEQLYVLSDAGELDDLPVFCASTHVLPQLGWHLFFPAI